MIAVLTMYTLLFAFVSVAIVVTILRGAMASQRERDANRKTYIVTFPSNTSADQARAWIRSIGGNLDNGLGALRSRPTIVFELHGKNFALEHRVRLPEGSLTEYTISQLRQQIPGASISPAEDEPIDFTYGVEIEMTDGSRSLRIASVKDHSNRVLAAAGALGEGERVVVSWVISHTNQTKIPPSDHVVRKSRNSVWDLLIGNTIADHDEVADRRSKATEPGFKAIGRIAAVAGDENRAREIVSRIEHALKSENNSHAYFKSRRITPEKLSDYIERGHTPAMFTTQLSVTELVAVLGWPIDGPQIAGLPHGVTKDLPASQDIASEGIMLGRATFPGGERLLAYSSQNATRHTYIPGAIGVGKTYLMLNMVKNVMDMGHGVIILDGKKDIAEGAIDYVPAHRLNDVIYLNFMDVDHPVGFNPLDQGQSSVAAGQIIALLEHLYPDLGLYAKQLISHGLRALAENTEATGRKYTIYDLLPLLQPENRTEEVWADELIKGLRDSALVAFFNKWKKLSADKKEQRVETVANKFWQFDSPELRGVLGQAESAFNMADIINGNKILIVKIVGMSKGSREIASVMLMNALWSAVQINEPERENFLFLDEFADMMNMPVDYEEMLAKARSMKLPMVLANQNFTQLTPNMQAALMSNALTKIAFQLSSSDGKKLANEFGGSVSSDDLTTLEVRHAIARIATPNRASPPVTLTTLDPLPKTGLSAHVVSMSRQKAMPPDAVERLATARRTALKPPPRERRPVGEVEEEDY